MKGWSFNDMIALLLGVYRFLLPSVVFLMRKTRFHRFVFYTRGLRMLSFSINP
jgi:hypothetical protein